MNFDFHLSNSYSPNLTNCYHLCHLKHQQRSDAHPPSTSATMGTASYCTGAATAYETALTAVMRGTAASTFSLVRGVGCRVWC